MNFKVALEKKLQVLARQSAELLQEKRAVASSLEAQ